MQTLRAHQRASCRSEIALPRIALAQLDERRQEACECLAAARRRDQQRGPPCPCFRQQVELMRARLPATACEPARKDIRQRLSCVEEIACRFHGFSAAPTRPARERARPFPYGSRLKLD